MYKRTPPCDASILFPPRALQIGSRIRGTITSNLPVKVLLAPHCPITYVGANIITLPTALTTLTRQPITYPFPKNIIADFQRYSHQNSARSPNHAQANSLSGK
ncbi:MAG TPA: hypothetical protein DCS90_10915 [Ktedonobacter sp.]|nr:hypothetical protein [Ktedonobacter sp.]